MFCVHKQTKDKFDEPTFGGLKYGRRGGLYSGGKILQFEIY